MREIELKDMKDKLTDMQSLLLEIRNDFKPGHCSRGVFLDAASNIEDAVRKVSGLISIYSETSHE